MNTINFSEQATNISLYPDIENFLKDITAFEYYNVFQYKRLWRLYRRAYEHAQKLRIKGSVYDILDQYCITYEISSDLKCSTCNAYIDICQKHIYINERAVARMRSHALYNMNTVKDNDIIAVFLCHELYHYIVHRSVKKLQKYHEFQAHCFAKFFLELDFFPYLYAL